MNSIQVISAQPEHIEQLASLFNQYRMFYKQEDNFSGAKAFIQERLKQEDSTLFLAINKEGLAVGFTQLYGIFSSVAMKRVFVLNDLFVAPKGRNLGVGTALLEQAKTFATSQGARGLVLETDADNPAQQLYHKNGWTLDSALHFYWEV